MRKVSLMLYRGEELMFLSLVQGEDWAQGTSGQDS